jgi:hypothetical protein
MVYYHQLAMAIIYLANPICKSVNIVTGLALLVCALKPAATDSVLLPDLIRMQPVAESGVVHFATPIPVNDAPCNNQSLWKISFLGGSPCIGSNFGRKQKMSRFVLRNSPLPKRAIFINLGLGFGIYISLLLDRGKVEDLIESWRRPEILDSVTRSQPISTVSLEPNTIDRQVRIKPYPWAILLSKKASSLFVGSIGRIGRPPRLDGEVISSFRLNPGFRGYLRSLLNLLTGMYRQQFSTTKSSIEVSKLDLKLLGGFGSVGPHLGQGVLSSPRLIGHYSQLIVDGSQLILSGNRISDRGDHDNRGANNVRLRMGGTCFKSLPPGFPHMVILLTGLAIGAVSGFCGLCMFLFGSSLRQKMVAVLSFFGGAIIIWSQL